MDAAPAPAPAPAAPAAVRLSLGEKLLVRLAFFAGAVVAVWLALPVDAAPILGPGAHEDVLRRVRYLRRRLREEVVLPQQVGTGSEQFNGEYAFGTYAMAVYGLTNVGCLAPETREQSREVAALCIERAMSPAVRAFDRAAWGEDAFETLAGDRGHVAYLGYLNLMFGGYRVLGGDARFDDLHGRVTDAVARRLSAAPYFHAETYPHEVYTMDNLVAAAGLAVADRVRGTDHGRVIEGYLDFTERRLVDAQNGLIRFAIERDTGTPLQRGRGCAGGWSTFFLPFLDRALAARQYEALRRHNLGWVGPFAAMREYAPDDPDAGYGDIDSGPVLVFGVSATGFSIAGARWARDAETYSGLLSMAEVFGVSVDEGDERRYVSAPLLGEAIMLAMKTAGPWWEGMGERRAAPPAPPPGPPAPPPAGGPR